MKLHVLAKSHEQLAGSESIPNWVDFIHDKSRVRDRFNPEVDRVLDDLGFRVWVTHEYRPANSQWNSDEIREGLDRTYRLIFQQDYELPADLADRLRALPSIESAH